MLSKSGIDFQFKNDRDYSSISNDKEISSKIVKTRAIPQLLALGQFTIGFLGLDLIKEAGFTEIKPILDLKLNPVRLVVAVRREQKGILINPPKRPIVIATEYENIAHEWAMKNNLAHIIIQTWGSTEAYAPDDADIVFDNIDTGKTMEANNLIVIDEIMHSSTCLAVNIKAYDQDEIKMKVDEIVKKLKAQIK